jgi:hypothetical protein
MWKIFFIFVSGFGHFVIFQNIYISGETQNKRSKKNRSMTFTHNQLLQIRVNKKAARNELDKAGLNDWKLTTKLEGNNEPPTKINRDTKTISIDKLILSSIPEDKFIYTFLTKIDEIKKPKLTAPTPVKLINSDDELDNVKSQAEDVLTQYNLIDAGWGFTWKDEPKTYLGVCNFKYKQISLNKRWIKVLPPEEITDVILHEVAHALVGARERHNNVWKSKCKEIGARPSARSDFSWGSQQKDLEMYEKLGIKKWIPKYIMTCPECGKESYTQKNTPTSCGRCSNVYDEKYKMVVRKYKSN